MVRYVDGIEVERPELTEVQGDIDIIDRTSAVIAG